MANDLIMFVLHTTAAIPPTIVGWATNPGVLLVVAVLLPLPAALRNA